MIDQSKPPLNELAHYGKKGMKWGVRKGYVERRTRQAEAAGRVGADKAKFGDRLKSGTLLSTRGEATRKSKKIQAHADRIKRGEAKVVDLLALYGTATIYDVGRQSKNYGRAKKA